MYIDSKIIFLILGIVAVTLLVLLRSLSKKNDKISRNGRTISDLTNANSEKKQEIDLLKQNIAQIKEEKIKISVELSFLKRTSVANDKELKRFKEENKQLKEKLKVKEDELSNSQSALKKSHYDLTQSISKLESKAIEIDVLQRKVSDSKKSIQQREKELKIAHNELTTKNTEIERLKKDVAFFSDVSAASQGLNESEEHIDLTIEDLDEEQKDAFNLMSETNCNIFITGKAGTGKSTLLRVFAQNTKKLIVKLAPTGIAALNIKGSTLHSAFGYNNLALLNYEEITRESIKLKTDKRVVLKFVNTIIIDEISMVRADVLEKIDQILKIVNGNDLPFGGKQMILFGDLFQLPPIAKKEERLYLNDVFGGIHFFNSFAYKSGNFTFIELTVNHRQMEDKQFFEILNDIREGKVSEKQLEIINTRTEYDKDELRAITRVLPTKDEVEAYNRDILNHSIGKIFESKAKIVSSDKNTNLNIDNNFPIQQNLKLKKGALVMFVKNNGDKWVNGTIGIVSDIHDDYLEVSVNNETFAVRPNTFEQYEAIYQDGKIEYQTSCEILQYPVVLAYAMTIHKAQGQTYGKIACDVSKCFAPGQAYVALSRVKALSGLYLLDTVSKWDIQVDPIVYDFYQANKQLSVL